MKSGGAAGSTLKIRNSAMNLREGAKVDVVGFVFAFGLTVAPDAPLAAE
jgi:hypothetical protein